MLLEEIFISSIASSILVIFSLQFNALFLVFEASKFASLALFALCFVCTDISSNEAESSSTELACSVVAWESSRLESDTSLAPLATFSEEMLISFMISFKLSFTTCMDFARVPISSFFSWSFVGTSMLRLRFAMFSEYLTVSIIGLAIALPRKNAKVMAVIRITVTIIDMYNWSE